MAGSGCERPESSASRVWSQSDPSSGTCYPFHAHKREPCIPPGDLAQPVDLPVGADGDRAGAAAVPGAAASPLPVATPRSAQPSEPQQGPAARRQIASAAGVVDPAIPTHPSQLLPPLPARCPVPSAATPATVRHIPHPRPSALYRSPAFTPCMTAVVKIRGLNLQSSQQLQRVSGALWPDVARAVQGLWPAAQLPVTAATEGCMMLVLSTVGACNSSTGSLAASPAAAGPAAGALTEGQDGQGRSRQQGVAASTPPALMEAALVDAITSALDRWRSWGPGVSVSASVTAPLLPEQDTAGVGGRVSHGPGAHARRHAASLPQSPPQPPGAQGGLDASTARLATVASLLTPPPPGAATYLLPALDEESSARQPAGMPSGSAHMAGWHQAVTAPTHFVSPLHASPDRSHVWLGNLSASGIMMRGSAVRGRTPASSRDTLMVPGSLLLVEDALGSDVLGSPPATMPFSTASAAPVSSPVYPGTPPRAGTRWLLWSREVVALPAPEPRAPGDPPATVALSLKLSSLTDLVTTSGQEPLQPSARVPVPSVLLPASLLVCQGTQVLCKAALHLPVGVTPAEQSVTIHLGAAHLRPGFLTCLVLLEVPAAVVGTAAGLPRPSASTLNSGQFVQDLDLGPAAAAAAAVATAAAAPSRAGAPPLTVQAVTACTLPCFPAAACEEVATLWADMQQELTERVAMGSGPGAPSVEQPSGARVAALAWCQSLTPFFSDLQLALEGPAPAPAGEQEPLQAVVGLTQTGVQGAEGLPEPTVLWRASAQTVLGFMVMRSMHATLSAVLSIAPPHLQAELRALLPEAYLPELTLVTPPPSPENSLPASMSRHEGAQQVTPSSPLASLFGSFPATPVTRRELAAASGPATAIATDTMGQCLSFMTAQEALSSSPAATAGDVALTGSAHDVSASESRPGLAAVAAPVGMESACDMDEGIMPRSGVVARLLTCCTSPCIDRVRHS